MRYALPVLPAAFFLICLHALAIPNDAAACCVSVGDTMMCGCRVSYGGASCCSPPCCGSLPSSEGSGEPSPPYSSRLKTNEPTFISFSEANNLGYRQLEIRTLNEQGKPIAKCPLQIERGILRPGKELADLEKDRTVFQAEELVDSTTAAEGTTIITEIRPQIYKISLSDTVPNPCSALEQVYLSLNWSKRLRHKPLARPKAKKNQTSTQ